MSPVLPYWKHSVNCDVSNSTDDENAAFRYVTEMATNHFYLVEWLEYHEMLPADLARGLGCTRGAVSKWIKAGHLVPVRAQDKIAKFFNVHIGDLWNPPELYYKRPKSPIDADELTRLIDERIEKRERSKRERK